MTRCSDNDEQSDDEAEKPNKNQKKRSKGEKHVSFPPDEKIVSGFAEHMNTDRKGKLLCNFSFTLKCWLYFLCHSCAPSTLIVFNL